MQIKLVLAIAAATFTSYAAAQKCAAQAILDECLKNAKNVVDNCGDTDYKCLCQTNKAMLECYINCPQDPNKGTQESVVSSWCVSAGGEESSSSSSASPSTTEGGSSSAYTPSSTPTGAPEETPSGTDTEEQPSTTDKELTPSETPDSAGSAVSPVMSFGIFAGFAAVAGALF